MKLELPDKVLWSFVPRADLSHDIGTGTGHWILKPLIKLTTIYLFESVNQKYMLTIEFHRANMLVLTPSVITLYMVEITYVTGK